MLAITIPSPRVPYEDHTEGAAMSVTPHAVPAPPEVAASSAAFAVTGVAFGGGSMRSGTICSTSGAPGRDSRVAASASTSTAFAIQNDRCGTLRVRRRVRRPRWVVSAKVFNVSLTQGPRRPSRLLILRRVPITRQDREQQARRNQRTAFQDVTPHVPSDPRRAKDTLRADTGPHLGTARLGVEAT